MSELEGIAELARRRVLAEFADASAADLAGEVLGPWFGDAAARRRAAAHVSEGGVLRVRGALAADSR